MNRGLKNQELKKKINKNGKKIYKRNKKKENNSESDAVVSVETK